MKDKIAQNITMFTRVDYHLEYHGVYHRVYQMVYYYGLPYTGDACLKTV